jgi:hypothetical protein
MFFEQPDTIFTINVWICVEDVDMMVKIDEGREMK